MSYAASILLLWLGGAHLDAGQANPLVGVEQITTSRSSAAPPAQPARPPASQLAVPQLRGGRERAGTRTPGATGDPPREIAARAITREMVRACRAAQGGEPAPQGIDCPAVLAAVARAAQETTPEGTLLTLFGQSATVTGQGSVQQNSGLDADAVARQLSTGDVQDSSNIGAAGVAARLRGTPAPTPPPR